jgi:hypothetical protein
VNGATLAQKIWCKITAGNDRLSQSICLANLAVQGAQQNAAPAQPIAAVARPRWTRKPRLAGRHRRDRNLCYAQHWRAHISAPPQTRAKNRTTAVIHPVISAHCAPKIDREWRTTHILAGVIALLCVAVAVVVAVRYF